MRIGALAGAAALVGLAASRRTPLAVSGATAVAIPLVVRGATGHWPLESVLAHPVRVERTITIFRSPEDVWDYWSRLVTLPRFMRHLEAVDVRDARRSHWVARTPLGELEWDAEIVEARRGRRLAWRSVAGSPIDTRGRLALAPAPADRGTTVRLELALDPPARRAGRLAAALLQPATGIEIREDLRRFKSLLEAGEIPTTAGQPHARAFELGGGGGARARRLGAHERAEARR
jgi:uncharacterized membrane protein